MSKQTPNAEDWDGQQQDGRDTNKPIQSFANSLGFDRLKCQLSRSESLTVTTVESGQSHWPNTAS